MTVANEVTDEEVLHQLRLAYTRAFNEYSEATFAIKERVRHRSLPTAAEFARKRTAHTALLDASRAVWKARRRTTQQT